MQTIGQLVCGTGGWVGPLPGDPSSDLILRATPAFGGVDITLSYPSVNPEALSHTILYRGTSNVFDHAVRHTEFSGTFFHDRTTSEVPVLYYYWATTVSVNGTVGELLGPASAMARPLIADVIAGLTAKIDAGHLAQSLRTEIARIDWLEDGIHQESLYRANEHEAMAQAFSSLQATVGEASSLLLDEVRVRSDQYSTMAEAIRTTQSVLGDNIASAEVRMGTHIDTINGELRSIGALYTAKLSVNGLIGGFGMYNDGTEVQAGFDVDTFWVGRTKENMRKPFIISGGQVYIDEAAIHSLVFSKLRDEAGSFIVSGGQVKADYIDTKGLVIRDAAGNPIFGAGKDLDVSRIVGNWNLGSTTGSLPTSKVTGNLPTSRITGNWNLSATSGSLSTSKVTGNLPSSRITGLGAMAIVNEITQSNSATYIKYGAIDMAMIRNLVVGAAHIQDLSVNSLKIGNGAVLTDKIGLNAVSSTSIFSGTGTGYINTTSNTTLIFIYLSRVYGGGRTSVCQLNGSTIVESHGITFVTGSTGGDADMSTYDSFALTAIGSVGVNAGTQTIRYGYGSRGPIGGGGTPNISVPGTLVVLALKR